MIRLLLGRVLCSTHVRIAQTVYLKVSLFRRTALTAAGDAVLARAWTTARFSEEIVILSAGAPSIERYLRGRDVRIIALRAGCSYRLIPENWLALQGVVRAWTITALTAQR